MIYQNFIKFKLMRPGAILPKRATDGSGAFDFFAPESGNLVPGEKKLIPSGIAHDMPGDLYLKLYHLDPDCMGGDSYDTQYDIPIRIQGILFDRSGLGGKSGIRLSFACLIDNDYRGEILLSLENHSNKFFRWEAGMRLCQIAYVPMFAGRGQETTVLSTTERGVGGFGSTGK